MKKKNNNSLLKYNTRGNTLNKTLSSSRAQLS